MEYDTEAIVLQIKYLLDSYTEEMGRKIKEEEFSNFSDSPGHYHIAELARLINWDDVIDEK